MPKCSSYPNVLGMDKDRHFKWWNTPDRRAQSVTPQNWIWSAGYGIEWNQLEKVPNNLRKDEWTLSDIFSGGAPLPDMPRVPCPKSGGIYLDQLKIEPSKKYAKVFSMPQSRRNRHGQTFSVVGYPRQTTYPMPQNLSRSTEKRTF